MTSGVTLAFEASMGHQLEYIKIVRQTTMQPYHVIVSQIVSRRGIVGLWDGFLPWGATQAVTKGAVFGFAYNLLKRLFAGLGDDIVSPSVGNTLAGAGAGGFQGLVLSPMLLLKTRVMTDPIYQQRSAQPGASALLESFSIGWRVVRTEGVASLLKGAGTFAAKRVGDWGSRYAFTNAAENAIASACGARRLSYTQKISAALIGGLASSALTIPIDVMVANIQAASAAGKKTSFVGSFTDKFRNGGMEAVAGFATRGFLPRCIHVTLTTVVVITGTAYVQDLLDPPTDS